MTDQRYPYAVVVVLMMASQLPSQVQRTITPDERCLACPSIILTGNLAKWMEIAECKAISGMTCRIWFKRGGTLPSRIFVQESDSQGRPTGKKRALIYPNLKTGEKGWATFHLSRANAIVLTGEWKGSWKSAY